ncbi:MAG: hypothetical protein IJF71_06440 [Clostridia bacterium]|nr:hypothetical protein [Clostridia bacterium]
MDFIKQLGKLDLTKYGSIPFWSWNNRLEKEELIKQIHQMKEIHCGGFIMHARLGLCTEYLSEEWFSMIEACLDEAKKLGMRAWVYDENGWPSGFVGGKLLDKEENLACYLSMEKRESFDESALAVFERIGGRARRLSAEEAPEDGCYYTVYLHRSPSNTDILNPDVVTQFIEQTYELYYKRYGDRFGKEFVGFFTDEPQYFRWGTPYTPMLTAYYKETYGEDVLDGIVHLFFDDEAAFGYRVRYYKAMNELYTKNFYKRLYDWCEERGCMLTGHSIEEGLLSAQMLGCAGVTPSYEFEHIPGIDNLGQFSDATLSARQVGSAAGQLGKEQILTESFGCSSFSATPSSLKAILEKQYVHGVNMLCQHLYSYTLKGQGKVDHPPCFSKHMTWWKAFPDFNLYFNRLGYLLATTPTAVNCAVISPLQDVYLEYDRMTTGFDTYADREFHALQKELNAYGILYDIADEAIMAEYAGVEGSSLTVGKRTYEYIIVPCSRTLRATTKQILEAFVRAGGKVVVYKDVPTYTDGEKDDWSFLSSSSTLEEIAKNGAVYLKTDGRAEYTYRKGNGAEFLYIVNVTGSAATVTLPSEFARVDLLKLTASRQARTLTLGAGESAILVPGKGEPVPVYGEAKEITKAFSFVKAGQNNLTLDAVSVKKGEGAWSEEKPLACAFDELLHEEYKGKLQLKFAFNVRGKGSYMRLRRETGEYYTGAWLNGNALTFEKSDFDFLMEETDITPFVLSGKNEYIVELDYYQRPHVAWALYDPGATESVRNCLYYDTELENVYILGDFCVDNERNIIAPTVPYGMDSLQMKGFPYFVDTVEYRAELMAEGERALLTAQGPYQMLTVLVNGKEVGVLSTERALEIPLEKGRKNEITLQITASLRNMFGPFHYKGDEDYGVSPYTFTCRGSWQNGKSADYAPQYVLKPFGVNCVTVAYAK